MQISLNSIVINTLRLLLVCSLCLCNRNTWAQSDYASAGILYKDQYVSVELLFKMNSCSNTKVSRYRYIITGDPRGQDFYVNWKMDFYNCHNTITCQTNSLNIGSFTPDPNGALIDDMDWTFNATQLYKKFYDVKASNSPNNSAAYDKPLPMSVKPKGIEGDLYIEYGDAVTLTQKGGALGENAEWHWYISSCGGRSIAKGESIVVRPHENTRYFVRAEGPQGLTDCVIADVTVDTKSKAPNGITGKNAICVSDKNISLVVNGGKLGKLAKWTWYQDNISTQPIGTGAQIIVSPQRTTRYYVRAEGADNITESRDFTIKVINEQSTDPTGITGPSGVCEGKTITLQATGGKLSNDAQWCWYRNSVSPQNQVGKGSLLTQSPQQTTTYIMRGEGACRITTERSVQVAVLQQPYAPSEIEASETSVYSGKKVTLSVTGSPGENSKFVWYRKSVEGKPIGTGETIEVRARKETTYYVRGENDCGVSQMSARTLDVRQRFIFVNAGIITSFRTRDATGHSPSVGDQFKNTLDQKTFSITVGQVTNAGWYARIKYSLKNPKTDYNTNDKEVYNFNSTATYYKYNGKVQTTRLAGTFGLLLNLTKNTLLMNAGVGYGERKLLWGITEYNYSNNQLSKETWAKHAYYSLNGVETELGIMIKLPIGNIMLGANALFPFDGNDDDSGKKYYWDTYAGIGINF